MKCQRSATACRPRPPPRSPPRPAPPTTATRGHTTTAHGSSRSPTAATATTLRPACPAGTGNVRGLCGAPRRGGVPVMVPIDFRPRGMYRSLGGTTDARADHGRVADRASSQGPGPSRPSLRQRSGPLSPPSWTRPVVPTLRAPRRPPRRRAMSGYESLLPDPVLLRMLGTFSVASPTRRPTTRPSPRPSLPSPPPHEPGCVCPGCWAAALAL